MALLARLRPREAQKFTIFSNGSGEYLQLSKSAHFAKAVQLLGPIARQVLNEMNISLLRDTGQLTESGLRRTPDGGLNASWALSWPEQQATGIEPVVLQAYFGGGFHHPHLRGTTVHDWPLNVFSEEDAAAQLSTLRAIASSDLHNLVYLSDYRIVPVMTENRASRATVEPEQPDSGDRHLQF